MAAIEKETLAEANGHGGGARRTALTLVKADGGRPRELPAPPSPEEGVEVEARGWRAWLRMFQIARVLGTLALYLFLND
jgi:hypothetical protein